MPHRLLLAARIAIGLGAAVLLGVGILFLQSPSVSADQASRAGRPQQAQVLSPLPVPAALAPAVSTVAPETARQINAAIPFVAGPVPPARKFVFAGRPAERERALTCLAAAGWYEAGDDTDGQRAVVQVVLNRLRHPAFPKSICGVVFQGAERLSGCQFTFTCDGALARSPSPAAWARAREVATRALAGAVDRRVGTATHYHTDWVAPYWSPTLDKIVAVDTHLFFRWRGWWGTPAAFSGSYRGPEALDRRIARLAAPIGRADLALDASALALDEAVTAPAGTALEVPGVTTAALRGSVVRLMDASAAEYVIELPALPNPGGYALTALALCSGKPVCTVMGWLKRGKLPRAMPVTPAMMQSVSFLYRRNIDLDREQVFWNCQQFPKLAPVQCLPGTGPASSAPPA